MAEISAAAVAKLRKMSGQGMMDCKKALGETDGDLDKAMDLLRKKGLATLAKRAERATTEGRVVSKISGDHKTAVITSLCSETDFVAKSDDFIAAADLLADCGFKAAADSGAEVLLETEINGRKFSQILTDVVSKTGEKLEVGQFTRYTLSGTGVFGSYVHINGKVGALLEVEASSDTAAKAVQKTANEIAMHITAINPLGLDKTSMDPAVLEKERAIAAEQVKNKPANIIEKIVEGKIGKFLAENCLVEQPFVKDDTQTVGQVLEKAAKSAGGTAKIKRFVRVEIG
jgi:elongation factor Ts